MARIFSRLCFSFLTCGAALQGVSTPNTADADVALPDVDAMMAEATKTVATLTRTADKMEQVMNHTQSQHQRELDQLRASYTGRLAEQDRANERLANQNGKLKRLIDSLGDGNKLIRNAGLMLQETNKGMRTMLAAFKPKFSAADTFLLASMNASEAPLHATELQVLREPLPPPTLENFLEKMGTDSDNDRKHSLMQVAGKSGTFHRIIGTAVVADVSGHARLVAEETAENVVSELSKQITKIGQARAEGGNKLKAEFLANFEARQLKTDQLLLEQKQLNETKALTLQEQRDLYDAKKALQNVNVDLVSRIRGISSFAQKTSKYIQDRIAESKNVTKGTKLRNGLNHHQA